MPDGIETAHYRGDAGRAYYEARQRDRSHIGHEVQARYFLQHLEGVKRCLDFGCGNGWLVLALQKKIPQVEGVEVNPKAREEACASGARVYASLDHVPEGRCYDAVISNHVLEHVADVPATLASIRRYLSDQGRVVIIVPIDDFRDKHQRSWSSTDIDFHLHTWTPRLIANNFYLAGYDVDHVRVITSAWNRRLFWLHKLGLHELGFWLFAVLTRRRQLLVVARPAKGSAR